jgi:hypothetical protein
MKKTIHSIGLILAIAIFFSACKKDKSTPVSGDYLVVGHTGGFVSNLALTPYYLINNGQLLKDTTIFATTHIPDDVNSFHFYVLLPSVNYDSVATLLTTIPSELLSRNGQSIGTALPDAGYTDVRTSINGIVYKWHFEVDQSTSSSEVRTFATRLNFSF